MIDKQKILEILNKESVSENSSNNNRVIIEQDFEIIAEEIAKLFAIPAVVGQSEQLAQQHDAPIKIYVNVYNPIKPNSWDCHITEQSAVINSIGAKTHCYIHESLFCNDR